MVSLPIKLPYHNLTVFNSNLLFSINPDNYVSLEILCQIKFPSHATDKY